MIMQECLLLKCMARSKTNHSQSRYRGRPLSSSGSGLRRNRPLARLLSQCSLAARTSSSTKLCGSWASQSGFMSGPNIVFLVYTRRAECRGERMLLYIPRCSDLGTLRLTCRGAAFVRRGCCLRTSCQGAARGCPARQGPRSGAFWFVTDLVLYCFSPIRNP